MIAKLTAKKLNAKKLTTEKFAAKKDEALRKASSRDLRMIPVVTSPTTVSTVLPPTITFTAITN